MQAQQEGWGFAFTLDPLVITFCSSLVCLSLDLELGEERVPLGARC